MEVFNTILAGTLVYIASKLIERLIIEPILQLKATIRKTENYLILYADVYSTTIYPLEYIQNITFKYRELASSLISDASSIPLYFIVRLLFHLPKRKDIVIASENLIGYSNNTAKPEFVLRMEQQKNIQKHLGFASN